MLSQFPYASQQTSGVLINYQSLSVVDDAELFQLLKAPELKYTVPSRKYVMETVMLKLYDDVKTAVNKNLTGISHIRHLEY